MKHASIRFAMMLSLLVGFQTALTTLLLSPAFAKEWINADCCSNPESSYYDPETRAIYVSSVAGEGVTKDGNGWISKLSIDGKTVTAKWVSGLNAPKGIRVSKGTLWVTDIDELVAIDIKTAQIKDKIAIAGAKFLNDVAIDEQGKVYVSDTLTGTIHLIQGKTATVFLSGPQLESPNGLIQKDGRLYVVVWGLTTDWTTKVPGRLYSIDLKTKKITFITKDPLGNLDGLEMDRKGRFLASDWSTGKVYRLDQSGKSTLLTTGKQGYADIGYIPETDTLLIPSMQESKVIGIELK